MKGKTDKRQSVKSETDTGLEDTSKGTSMKGESYKDEPVNQPDGTVNKVLTDIIKTFPETGATEGKGAEAEPKKITSLRHEVPMFVPKVEVHEIVKEVPTLEIEYIEKIIEVPKLEYVDIYEEVNQIEYITKEVPKIEIVQVPREVIKRVPRIETKVVERIVNVPASKTTYVAVPFPVEAQFLVPKFKDNVVSVPISQEIQPEIYETRDICEVDVAIYEPKLIPVDVYVPKLVVVPIKDLGIVATHETKAEVTDLRLLQQLTLEMNPHLLAAKQFNALQARYYQRICSEAQDKCAAYQVETPQPVMLPMVKTDGSAAETETFLDVFTATQVDFFEGLPGFAQDFAAFDDVEQKTKSMYRRSRGSSGCSSKLDGQKNFIESW